MKISLTLLIICQCFLLACIRVAFVKFNVLVAAVEVYMNVLRENMDQLAGWVVQSIDVILIFCTEGLLISAELGLRLCTMVHFSHIAWYISMKISLAFCHHLSSSPQARSWVGYRSPTWYPGAKWKRETKIEQTVCFRPPLGQSGMACFI